MSKNIKFQTKIIIVQTFIVLFVTLTVSILYYNKIADSLIKQANKDFRTLADSIANQLDNHFYMMDKTALQIAANPVIVQAFMRTGKKQGENYFAQEPLIQSNIVKLLHSYNFKKDGFARICLYNKYSDFLCSALAPATETGIAAWFQSDRFYSVTNFFDQEAHFVCFLPPAEDILNDTELSQTRYFSVIRQIKDYTSNSQKCGYVEIQEFEKWINTLFANIGKDIFAVILDENRTSIYKNFEIKDTELLRILEAQLVAGKTGHACYADKQYVYFKNLENAPFSIGFAKNESAMNAALRQYNFVIIAGLTIIFITALITEILLVRKLSKPLAELNYSIRNIVLDNPQLELNGLQSSDELIGIKRAFNAVLARMKDAMEREYRAQTNEMKSQFFALQSQMNPHFLHNILAIISIEAEQFGNGKIQNMCSRLSGMLRFSASMGDGFCLMEEEMQYAANYLNLMKERYEDMFEYNIAIDNELKNICIPKYIVQPICENSFIHSFRKTEPVWEIHIQVFRKEKNWFIAVKDNGTGFSDNYLEEFEKMKTHINLKEVRRRIQDISIGGLCIPNIYMRLMLCYEKDFTFKINNEEGAAVLLGGKIHD